jgi:hypothetical protein
LSGSRFRCTKPRTCDERRGKIIGTAGLAALSPALRKAEERLGRAVNVTTYSPDEFREKVKSGDHFLTAVLGRRKQFVKESQSDLDEIVGK